MKNIISSLEKINLIVGSCVKWFALLMVLLQFAIVVMRYVFGVSYIFLNEGVLYLHAFLFMLGAGYTLLVDKHVRVDIFYAVRSSRGKALTDIGGHLFFLIPSMVLLLYYSWPSVKHSWMIFEGAISVGGIPASFLLKSLIPAFASLLIIQCLANLLKDLLLLRSSDT
ncbi:MAG: TRAP transporter small permease subunit [Desulfopila sp.]|nr:TRAP transporter small permease subunit [Desulfopila sp.]